MPNGIDQAGLQFMGHWSPCPIIVIGASLGGLSAIRTVLGAFPKDFPGSIVVVQHRGKDVDGALREMLQKETAMPVREAEDKAAIMAGIIYLARLPPARRTRLLCAVHRGLDLVCAPLHRRPLRVRRRHLWRPRHRGHFNGGYPGWRGGTCRPQTARRAGRSAKPELG